MRTLFHQELEQVGEELVVMARHAATAIEHASTSLRTADLQLAESVIEADAHLDAIETRLDDQCVTLLARQQPVATDLRVVVTALRLSATIERMGDLARHVAEVARGRFPEKALPESFRSVFDDLGEAAASAANEVVRLLRDHDLELAATIERDDATLDALHRETFRKMLAEPSGRELSPQQLIDITLLGRYYERFGDHAVSAARRVTYLITGDIAASTAHST